MVFGGTVHIHCPISAYYTDTALHKGDSGGGTGMGGDGGGGGGRACALPDGRSIPPGQEFNYVQNGMSLVCTCPNDLSPGKVEVQCRQDSGGKLLFLY